MVKVPYYFHHALNNAHAALVNHFRHIWALGWQQVESWLGLLMKWDHNNHMYYARRIRSMQSAQQHHLCTDEDDKNVLCNKKHEVDESLDGIYQYVWTALLVLDSHEEIVSLHRPTAPSDMKHIKYSEFVLNGLWHHLLSLHFVLIYFYTIAMMYIGLACCHTDGVRHIMATNGGAPDKAILYHAGANNVAISLLSKQCLWAVAVCSHTITTKYIGALNTSDCSGNSIGYKIVVALLLMLASLNSTTSAGPKLCGISSINAVRLSSGNVFLYYRYQAEWATNCG